MTNEILLGEYRGYVGSVEYSKEDVCFFGKLLFIPDLILYESSNLEGLQAAFHEAVDNYLENCAALRIKPHKTTKGSLNVRIPEQLHVDLVRYALEHGLSLNAVVAQAAALFLESKKRDIGQ